MQKLFTLLLAVCFTASLFSQNTLTKQKPVSAMETHAVFLGKTAPISELAPMSATRTEQKAKVRMKRPPRNFIGRGMDFPVNPNAQPQGFDAVRQSAVEKAAGFPILVNVDGVDAQSSPHDPSGDIGKDFYVQAVNATNFQVFDKTDGSPATGVIAANTLWASINRSSAGDPIVLFDQEAERWIITEFPPGNELLFAISETTDPRGSYLVYTYATPVFPDYPKYSIWGNAYVVTTNEEGVANQTAYFINRQDMLSGMPEVPIQRILVPGLDNGPGFFVGTPVDWSGSVLPVENDRPMIMRQNDDAWGNVPKDQIDIFTFDIDWDNPENTTFDLTELITSPYDSDPCSVAGPGFSCVPQLGGSGIDGIPAVIMNQTHYRNYVTHESIVLSFVTDASAGGDLSGIRWMELRRTDTTEWIIHQEGTYAPDDGLDRYVPAIAQDVFGNISIAYSASSEDQYVSLYFTGRRATDPLGTMTIPETEIVAGQSPIRSGGRYGDYAQMSVDPYNDRVFWFTSEYPTEAGTVTSRIAAWNLTKDTIDIAAFDLTTPVSAALLTTTETVTMIVRNTGVEDQTEFKVGYAFEGQAPVIEDVTFDLRADSIYTHVFAQTVDMSAIGEYRFKVFTDLTDDEAKFNDTLEVIRVTLPANDAGVMAIAGIPSTTCVDTVAFIATLSNNSGLPLTSVDFVVSLNGSETVTIPWMGNLPSLQSIEVELVLRDLADAFYTLQLATANPNGNTDEVSANDGSSVNFTVLSTGESFSLALNLDDYPEETRWELTNELGNVLASGGPYDGQFFATIAPEFCLNPDGCYTFTLFDSFGDGLFINEDAFTITSTAGEVVASARPNFGNRTSAEFCATDACLLEVDIASFPVSEAGMSDGAIMLFISNTDNGEFQISIDGGVTFGPLETTTFRDLAVGDYEIIVTNSNGCEFRETVSLGLCALAATVTVRDSIIGVLATGGDGNYQYSIDNDDFQNSPVFGDVGPGTYTVLVRDESGCETSVSNVVVDFTSDVLNTSYGQRVTLFPNPTEGVFRVKIEGLTGNNVFLPIEIFDATGRRLQSGKMVRYNADYYGQFSLVTYPNGVYYLRVMDERVDRLLRVVKN
jgi:hypothetical protein